MNSEEREKNKTKQKQDEYYDCSSFLPRNIFQKTQQHSRCVQIKSQIPESEEADAAGICRPEYSEGGPLQDSTAQEIALDVSIKVSYRSWMHTKPRIHRVRLNKAR